SSGPSLEACPRHGIRGRIEPPERRHSEIRHLGEAIQLAFVTFATRREVSTLRHEAAEILQCAHRHRKRNAALYPHGAGKLPVSEDAGHRARSRQPSFSSAPRQLVAEADGGS